MVWVRIAGHVACTLHQDDDDEARSPSSNLAQGENLTGYDADPAATLLTFK